LPGEYKPRVANFTAMARKKNIFQRAWIPEALKPYVYNRYMCTFLGFIVWLTFFDKHDFILQQSYRNKLDDLKKEREYYVEQIDKNKTEMKELFTNNKNLEKFAREKYYMKRSNEDVFVFVDKNNKLLSENATGK
jgi:cell division protein DivIC